MKYCDPVSLKLALEKFPIYKEMLAEMELDTNLFFDNFHDSPDQISQWGHHYFCKDDGGLLTFDLNKPHEHICPICHKKYRSKLLDGVWTYFYRNQAVTNLCKAAVLSLTTRKTKYLKYIENTLDFYGKNYLEFKLHNKEESVFSSLKDAAWGCGRIMPQGLNEAIFIIRMLSGLEIVKNKLAKEQLVLIEKMCLEIFRIFKFQVDKVHNISVWYDSAIAVMGLFTHNQEMIDFAFEGEFGLYRQLKEGITKDGFWYEGSIHYHFFTLEATLNALLYAKVYRFVPNRIFKDSVERMLSSAYEYAFDNLILPNPNDGWPNINLKTYSYLYDIATKIFGEDSHIAILNKNIINGKIARTELPLSRPYYYRNEISLERLTLIPQFDPTCNHLIKPKAHNYKNSQFAILRNDCANIFFKYGHNGPSHAHPDKMEIEVMLKDRVLTRDLSNAGYGSDLCNEWHRMSVSHSTVVINGKNQISMHKGSSIHFRSDYLKARADDVYRDMSLDLSKLKLSMNHDEIVRYLMRYLSYTKIEAENLIKQPEGLQQSIENSIKASPIVDYIRTVKLDDSGFSDLFEVFADQPVVADYFFHSEAELTSLLKLKNADLGYKDFGYQHLLDVKWVNTRNKKITLTWILGDMKLKSIIHLYHDAKLYLMNTYDNPVNKFRTTIMIRCKNDYAKFKVIWHIVKEEDDGN